MPLPGSPSIPPPLSSPPCVPGLLPGTTAGCWLMLFHLPKMPSPPFSQVNSCSSSSIQPLAEEVSLTLTLPITNPLLIQIPTVPRAFWSQTFAQMIIYFFYILLLHLTLLYIFTHLFGDHLIKVLSSLDHNP